MAMETPRDLKYTDTHEWVKIDGKEITVGITDFAQEQLSDLTYVELPTVGESYAAQDEVAVLESVKAASDIYAPVAGEVTEVNNLLLDNPEVINSEPYSDGWIFKMSVKDEAQLESLMDSDQYDSSMPDDE